MVTKCHQLTKLSSPYLHFPASCAKTLRTRTSCAKSLALLAQVQSRASHRFFPVLHNVTIDNNKFMESTPNQPRQLTREEIVSIDTPTTFVIGVDSLLGNYRAPGAPVAQMNVRLNRGQEITIGRNDGTWSQVTINSLEFHVTPEQITSIWLE
jgi:hypothetical protein